MVILSFTGKLGGGDKITVQNFIGMNYDEEIAGTDLEKEYQFKVIKEHDLTHDEGEVINQTPPEGSRISKDDQVTLTVATHEDTLTVPDVYNKDANIAKQQISLAQLVPEIQTINDDTVEEGKVIRTSPERGDPVTAGDKVILFVSTGKSGNEVEVPSVVNLSFEDAKAQLESMGLGIRQVKEVDSDKAKGTVVSQSIKDKEMVSKGTIIDVEVSSGNKPAKTVNISFDLPNIGGTGTLKVFLDNQGLSEFDSQVLLSGGTYSKVAVSGTGTNSEVVITINDETYYKCNINFETGAITNAEYSDISSGSTEADNAGNEDNGHLFGFGE